MPRTHAPLETARRFQAAFGDHPATLADALGHGLTRAQLLAAVDRGLLLRPRHGQYQLADAAPESSAGSSRQNAAWAASAIGERWRTQHLADVRSALRAVGSGAFTTHDSAGLVLRAPRPDPRPPGLISLARPGIQDFSGPGLVVRGSLIPSAFVVEVDGIPTTDVRRTAVDLARGRSLPDALIPLDAAARRLVASASGAEGNGLREAVHDQLLRAFAAQELAYAVSACVGWPGIAAVRRALPYVDPAAESPLESRSRGWFLGAGLRGLEIGAAVSAGDRTYWADFCSRRHRVIGEADGWGKYGNDMDAVRRSLAEEKRRQADLEAEGWRFIRWTSLDTRQSVVSRMGSALR
jgi:hypothetical protein